MHSLAGKTIVNKQHPEWGTWSVRLERKGQWYEITNGRGTRVLNFDEAKKFWKIKPSPFSGKTTTCSVCKHNFPEEFGGNMCPRCEDLYMDARMEAADDARARGELE